MESRLDRQLIKNTYILVKYEQEFRRKGSLIGVESIIYYMLNLLPLMHKFLFR